MAAARRWPSRYGAPFLGAIPIAMSVREGGDLGVPIVAARRRALRRGRSAPSPSRWPAQVSIEALKAGKALPMLNLKK